MRVHYSNITINTKTREQMIITNIVTFNLLIIDYISLIEVHWEREGVHCIYL